MSEVKTEIEKEEIPTEIADLLAKAEANKPVEQTPTEDKPAEEKPAEENPAGDKPAEKNPAEEKPEEEKPSEQKLSLSDEELLAELKKRNINVEIPKKEEPTEEEKAKEKKDKVTAWALEKKLISTDTIGEYAKMNSESKIEIAFQLYKKEREGDVDGDNEPLSDEQLRNEFEDENFLFKDELDPSRKRAVKKLEQIANLHLKSKFGDSIESLESKYDEEMFVAQRSQKLDTTLSPLKESMIKDGLSVSIKDELDKEFTFKLPVSKNVAEKILANIKLAPLPFDGSEPDYTDQVTKIFKNAIIANNFESYLHEYATAYHSKKMKELKATGVGVDAREEKLGDDNSTTPKEIQEILDQANAKRTNKI